MTTFGVLAECRPRREPLLFNTMRRPLPYDKVSGSYQRRGFIVPRGNVASCNDTLSIRDAKVHQARLVDAQQVCTGRLISPHLGDIGFLGIQV
jgi:hypothetical protein